MLSLSYFILKLLLIPLTLNLFLDDFIYSHDFFYIHIVASQNYTSDSEFSPSHLLDITSSLGNQTGPTEISLPSFPLNPASSDLPWFSEGCLSAFSCCFHSSHPKFRRPQSSQSTLLLFLLCLMFFLAGMPPLLLWNTCWTFKAGRK